MIAPDDCPGEDGFDFTRFGVRVPTILVSAYIDPRTLVRAPDGNYNPFDHTSMIKTICNRWHIKTSLGARAGSDRTADISAVLTRDRPRERADLPRFIPRPYTPQDLPSASDHGLTALQRDIVGLVAAHASVDLPEVTVETIGEALHFFRGQQPTP